MGSRRKQKRSWLGGKHDISLGDRVILINTVLDPPPPLLMLCLFLSIPSKVVKKLDRLTRNILWQGGKEGKGNYLVKWNTVMLSKGKRALKG